MHKDQHHLRAYWAATRNIGWYIEKFGSSLLALTSFLTLLITSLQQYSFYTLPSDLVIELIVSVILCIVVISINMRLYTNNGDTGGELEDSIREFYKECYEQQELTVEESVVQNEE